MKIIAIIIFHVALFFAEQAGKGQSFVNLDFENASITTVYEPGGDFYTATVPGWTVNTFNYVNGDPNSIPYNNIALSNPAVDLEGSNYVSTYAAIQGNYSVLLQGGTFGAQNTNGASIGQTGQIPLGTQSVVFWAKQLLGNTLQVTFNGQPLTVLDTGSTATYDIYAANISADAGQTGLLQFSVPWENGAMIDNIQFSSSPAPEPSELALTALGTLLVGYRRWRKSKR